MFNISVIVTVYNGQDSIERCLSSIISQSYVNFELIIIDDGSNDSTLDIINTLIGVANHINVKVISRENKGVAASRQEGILLASGYYAIFLDSDDYASSTWLEELYSEALVDKKDIVVCDYYTVDRGKLDYQKQRISDNASDNISLMLQGHIHGFLWNKLVKKDFYSVNQFVDGINYLEDFIVLLQHFSQAKSFGYVDKALVYYSVDNANSITSRITYDKAMNLFAAVHCIEEKISHLADCKLYQKELNDFKLSQKVWVINRYIGIVPKKIWNYFPELDFCQKKMLLSRINYYMLFLAKHKCYLLSQFLLSTKKKLQYFKLRWSR